MTQYMMKTVNADGTSCGGFVWPLEVGAKVVAPDWNDDGGGLHGLHNGIGRGALLDWSDDAVWIVASVKKAEIVDLGGKIKVPRCKIVHVGNRESATRFLSDAGIVGPIVGGTATAGYEGTATAGDGGMATAGYGGTATAGDKGTLIIRRWDGKRDRTVVGYIGENGLEPNTPYKLNDAGEFVKADG